MKVTADEVDAPHAGKPGRSGLRAVTLAAGHALSEAESLRVAEKSENRAYREETA